MMEESCPYSQLDLDHKIDLHERFIHAADQLMKGQPFHNYRVDREAFVVDFYVPTHLVRGDLLSETNRQLRRRLWRELAPHPDLRGVQITTDADNSIGLLFFNLAFPKTGQIEAQLEHAADVVYDWLVNHYPSAVEV